MNRHWIRVPIALCHSDDLHFLRRGLIPIYQYIQDILDCWHAKSRVNSFLSQRAILKAVKITGILKGIHRLQDLRRWLLKHERGTRYAKMIERKHRVKKARKIKDKTVRLDPAVEVLVVIGGAIVTCKGNNFRVRHAYRECSNNSACVIDLVPLAKQSFPHDAKKYAFANEQPALGEDHSGSGIRDTLKVLKRDDQIGRFHVTPNV